MVVVELGLVLVGSSGVEVVEVVEVVEEGREEVGAGTDLGKRHSVAGVGGMNKMTGLEPG